MVNQAPLLSLFVWALGLAVIYLVVRRSFRERLKDRDETITFLQKRVDILSQPIPTESQTQDTNQKLLPPVLKLMHFAFDDVEKNESGVYARVGKEFTTSSYKAAILDFSLDPISGAAPWAEAQAQIRFKDASNHPTRVSDPIWLGRDKPKVPFRYGETQSLVVTVCFPGEDFSTYEHQRRREQPLERALQGEVIRVEVGLVAEYMSDPQSSVSWYFKLSKGTDPTIEMITREEFEVEAVSNN